VCVSERERENGARACMYLRENNNNNSSSMWNMLLGSYAKRGGLDSSSK